MTVAKERYNAILSAQAFLRDLLDPSKTKRIPREIRRRAKNVLKHFPSEYEMKQIAEKAPKMLIDEWIKDSEGE